MKAPVELLAVAQTGLALRADPSDVFGVALVVGLGVVLLLVVSAMARPARGAERDVESSTMEPLSPEDALKLVAREAGSRLLLCPPGRNWGTATGAHPVAQWHWAQQWLRLRDSYNAKDLTRLAHAIRDNKIWTHLKYGVPVDFLTRYLEDELRKQREGAR